MPHAMSAEVLLSLVLAIIGFIAVLIIDLLARGKDSR
jgi:hypothetical protein